MSGGQGVPPAKRQRVHGVRGTVKRLAKTAAKIYTEGWCRGQGARLHVSTIRRAMNAGVDDLTTFMHTGDRLIMVLEKMSDLPEEYRIGNSKWNVFDVQREITTAPRPDAFSSPAAYMDMTADQLQVPESRSRLQTTNLLVSIRQILSVWNEVDLVTFMELFRRKSSGTGTWEDANSLQRFVDDCLKGVYCEFSGGKLKLYRGFSEEVIRGEMRRRYVACREKQPRERGKNDSIEGARVVETSEDMEAILDSMLEEATSNEVVVGVDCEGVNLGRSGSITLLQLATMDGHVYIFDIQKNPNLLKSGQLKQLLEDPKIIKVIHDCRNDSAALRRIQYNIKLAGVFDTSVAYSTIMEQCNKIGGPYRVGQKALCSALGEDTTFKDDAIFEKMTIDKQFWAQRPLTADMKNYAAADPASLVPHVYQVLDGMISPFWRDYFDAKCRDALIAL
ncbi:uncharacterized protein [Diadema setosum]|uniref:uncharacterized protein n=1 Tax=Diadema setosum TaxID=31175 RepID=UPI003B3B1B49